MLVVGGGIQGPVILVMHFWFDLTAGQAAVMYLLLLGALAIGLAIGLGRC